VIVFLYMAMRVRIQMVVRYCDERRRLKLRVVDRICFCRSIISAVMLTSMRGTSKY
jgi:hypothetical protein